MGTGNSRTQRALMDSVSADLSVSLDPNLDRVPAVSCTELGNFVGAPCIPAHYGRAACRVCAPCGGLCVCGAGAGGAERVRFGSTAVCGAACPLTPVAVPQSRSARLSRRRRDRSADIDSADLRSNAVSARHPHPLTAYRRTPDPRTGRPYTQAQRSIAATAPASPWASSGQAARPRIGPGTAWGIPGPGARPALIFESVPIPKDLMCPSAKLR